MRRRWLSLTPAGPYPTWVGRIAEKLGIRQGYPSAITNSDTLAANNIFARIDTKAHELFHAVLYREIPTWALRSESGHIARYAEEAIAYGLGHAASGRLHGVPFAFLEAGADATATFGPAAAREAHNFWGRLFGTGLVGAAEQLFDDAQHPNEVVLSK